MGERANYIVIENGKHEICRDNYGAIGMLSRFFWPVEAFDIVRDPSDPCKDDLYEVPLSEIIIDIDRKHLLLWGGDEVVPYHAELRNLYLAWMRISWSGWTVDWADREYLDVLDYLDMSYDLSGVERMESFSIIMGRLQVDSLYEYVPSHDGWQPSFFTLHEKGKGKHFLLNTLAGHGITTGPAFVELLEAADTPALMSPVSGQFVESTLLIDQDRRRLIFSMPGNYDPQWKVLAEEKWEGYEIIEHFDGIAGHYRWLGDRGTQGFARKCDVITALLRLVLFDGGKFSAFHAELAPHREPFDAVELYADYLRSRSISSEDDGLWKIIEQWQSVPDAYEIAIGLSSTTKE